MWLKENNSRPPRVYVISVQGVVAPYVIDGFAKGFAKKGCAVQCYRDFNATDILSEITAEVREFSPDFVVSYRDIALLKSLDGHYMFEDMGIPVVLLFYDNPFYEVSVEELQRFKSRPDLYHFFVFDTEYIDMLQEFGVKAHHLMLALDEDVFSEDKQFSTHPQYEYDVSFVGELAEIPSYENQQNEETREVMKLMYKYRKESTSASLRNILSQHYPTVPIEFSDYVALSSLLHQESAHFRWWMLSELKNIDIHVFGGDSSLSNILSHGRVDYLKELPEVYRKTKVNLNINSLQLENSINNRIFDVAGVGGFVLSDDKEDLYRIDSAVAKEIAYSSPAELRKKIDFFLNDENSRLAIAKTLHEKVLENHTYTHRAQKVLETVMAAGPKSYRDGRANNIENKKRGREDMTVDQAVLDPQEKEYDFVVPAVVEMVPQGLKTALDVGCSGGALGYYLKNERGFENVVGVEYSGPAVQKAKGYLDDVFEGDACAVELPEKYNNFFDIVIFADVLEHLYDPWAVVHRYKKYLKPGGYALASIPNLKNLYTILNLLSDRFDYTDIGLLDNTHVRFFTASTAVEMFVNEGFRLVQSQKSIRDSNWHKEINKGKSVNPEILNIYEDIFQKHYIRGEDCTQDLHRYFGLFEFTNDSVRDFLTVQFHLLFDLPGAA